jgi:alkylation response protein AidB-like acyl-CoA dehydrogenase
VTAAGAPEMRLFAVHRDQLRIENTWDVSGMRATGSNDVVVTDAFIPAKLVSSVDFPSRIDRPLYRGFLPTLVFPGCAAVVLGVARAAIDEAVGIVVDKAAVAGETVAHSRRAQYVIANSEAAVAAAKFLLLDAADALHESAASTGAVTIQQRASLRAAMSHAANTSRDALVATYELVGSTALYRTNRIERLFRDGMAALQHANNSAVFLEAAGRVRLGLDPGLPLF